MLYLIAIVPVLVVLFWRPLLKLLTPKGIPGVPAYDDPKPIWGDIHRFKRSIEQHGGFSRCFDNIAQDLGVIAQLRLGFFKNFIVLADLPTIEHVLLKQHGAIDRARQTTDIFRGLVPTGQISLPTNAQWKHHRRIVGPAMTSKYLALATPLASEAVADLVKYWRAKGEAAGGRSFAVEKDFEGATMDAICAMAFGSSWEVSKTYEAQAARPPTIGEHDEAVFDLEAPELYRSMIYLFDSVDNYAAFPRLSSFVTSLKPTYRLHLKRLDGYLKAKTKAARAWVREAPDAVDTAKCTLDMMVARESGDRMTDQEMRDELYLYLIAGTETSATTLSWWVKYMTNHPDIQKKLRKEILDARPEFLDRTPKFEELDVPYLEAVVHETLRLSRTAGGYAREAMEDVIILGKRIPKGTTIIIPTVTGLEDETNAVYSVPGVDGDARTRSEALVKDRDPSAARKVGYWEANTGRLFQPERWLKDGKFDANAGPSLPFSLGQRSCFGKNLALLELRLFICQLNLAFFFEAVPENQNSFEKFETITSHPKQSFARPVPWAE